QGGWNEAGTGAAGRAQDRRGPGDRIQGWARELHLKLLGLPAVLPPPEEEKDVKTAIGAARAKQARKEMLWLRGHPAVATTVVIELGGASGASLVAGVNGLEQPGRVEPHPVGAVQAEVARVQLAGDLH